MISEDTIQEIRDFVRERDWSRFHTPENLAKSISIEAAELLECYQWSPQMPPLGEEHVHEELADVLIYCIMLADRLGVDMDDIVATKLTKTRAKYPASAVRDHPDEAIRRHWAARGESVSADGDESAENEASERSELSRNQLKQMVSARNDIAIRTVGQATELADSMRIRHDLRWLLDEEASGVNHDYFGFWNGEDWASNFHPAPFDVDWDVSGDALPERTILHFACSEQWFMFRKAWRFNDADAMHAVLQPGLAPHDYKRIGRSVRNFDEVIWSRESDRYMLEALIFKFTQNPELAAALLGTGDQVLVECSPFDAIWGIRLGKRDREGRIDDRWLDPRNWKGRNRLGFLLMDLREALRA
ncbi:NADAR domain-containing protein [Bifidobacterium vansinderenii]